MELIVAEKPKVAEKIAHAISDRVEKKAHGGISYYELERDGEEVFIAPAVGHVFTLVEKEKGRGYPTFDIEWVPAYKASPKIAAYTKPYIELLQKLGRKADRFVSACDYDVEGCLPSFEKVVVIENNRSKIIDAGSYVDSYLQKTTPRFHNGFEFADVNPDSYIAAMDSGLRTRPVRIRKVMRKKGDGKILRITLEHGKHINVTKNHPLFVFSDFGLIQRRASDLKINEFLPSAKVMPIASTLDEIDVVEEIKKQGRTKSYYVYGFSKFNRKMPAEVSKICQVKRKTALGWRFFDRMPLDIYLKLETDKNTRNRIKLGVKKSKTKIPAILPLNKELGKLLGYYLAEGCLDTSGFIGFYFGPTENDLVDEVENIFYELFTLDKIKRRLRKVKGQYGNSITPEVGTKSKIVAFLFEKVFAVGKNSHKKCLPTFILSTPKEFQLGLLDGYLLGDGSVFIAKQQNRCVLSAGSVSRQLIEELHTLLISLGISSSIVHEGTRNFHFLNIGVAQEIYALFKLGGASVIERKNHLERLKEISNSNRTRNDPLFSLPNFLLQDEKFNYQTKQNILRGGTNARTSIHSLGINSTFVKRIVNGNVHPLKVLKIEEIPYEGYVYDFQTETSSFMHASGIITHNSTIAYNVFRFATTIKDGSRMKFSALTKSDLSEAYENRGDFDYNNAYAGEARHILDWYYGINLSRALMGSLRAASRYRVLSIGRVQGPALEVLCTLEKEIRAFVPSPYWELTVKINEVGFMHKTSRFLEEPSVDAAFEKTTGKAEITSVDKKEQEVPTPSNFDLTSLQMEAYRLFKYSPSRVMEIAQNLYEASVITYPRTSSQKIPASINVKAIVADLGKTPSYAELVKKITQNKWFTPAQGKKDDPAHPAIHPTGLPSSVSGPEKNLYDLIVRRFLSSFAPAASRERMRVEANSGGETYAASGSRLKDKGWVEFYGGYYTQEDSELPPFAIGGKHPLTDKKKERKETKPPKRYTQASIVSELEDRHLGTKSTRSVIVDTLVKRGYAQGASSLEVSDFGIKVCDVLAKYAPEILDENLTRKMEDEMEGIQEGKVDKDAVIREGKEILIQILDKWKKNEAKIGMDLLDALKNTEDKERQVGICDKCAKWLRIIRMRNGKQFIGCSGYPDCRNAYPLPGGAFVKTTEKLCQSCGKATVIIRRAKSRPFTMCIDPKCPSKASWGKKTETGPDAAPVAASESNEENL